MPACAACVAVVALPGQLGFNRKSPMASAASSDPVPRLEVVCAPQRLLAAASRLVPILNRRRAEKRCPRPLSVPAILFVFLGWTFRLLRPTSALRLHQRSCRMICTSRTWPSAVTGQRSRRDLGVGGILAGMLADPATRQALVCPDRLVYSLGCWSAASHRARWCSYWAAAWWARALAASGRLGTAWRQVG